MPISPVIVVPDGFFPLDDKEKIAPGDYWINRYSEYQLAYHSVGYTPPNYATQVGGYGWAIRKGKTKRRLNPEFSKPLPLP